MVKLLVTPGKISIFGRLAFQAKTQRHDLALEPRIKIWLVFDPQFLVKSDGFSAGFLLIFWYTF